MIFLDQIHTKFIFVNDWKAVEILKKEFGRSRVRILRIKIQENLFPYRYEIEI